MNSKPILDDLDLDNIEAFAKGKERVIGSTLGFAHPADTLKLIAEIRRLKRGEFTEAEFQALCHGFSEDDACRFRQGCEEYQRKLFGDNTIPQESGSPPCSL